MSYEVNESAILSERAQDLNACDQEPLRHISAVQGRGLLLVFDPDTQRLTNVSAAAGLFFNRDVEDLPGLHLRELFPLADFERLQTEATGLIRGAADGGRHFTVGSRAAYLFRTDQLLGLEIEFADVGAGDLAIDRLNLMSRAIAAIKVEPDLSAAGRAFCRAVREVSGMDRVMLYRFHRPSWHGEVLAEDKVAEAHSFLSHFFPASDIPRHARDLYLRNRLRFINDVDEPAGAVTPALNPRTRQPLDLADSRLRAVSPIHLEYLRNMGVRSSLSLAIVVDDQLWGLLACHGLEPKTVGARARAECEVLANAYAVRVRWEESNARNEARLALDRRLREIALRLARGNAPEADLLRHHRDLQDAFAAGGVALVTGGDVDIAGLTPPRREVAELARTLLARMDQLNVDVVATRKLSELDPRGEAYRADASGALALRLPERHDGVLVLFRPEAVRTVNWGGDPRKQLARREYRGRINPRLSFDSWTETIRNESAEWTDSEVEAATGFRDLVFHGFVRQARLLREMHAGHAGEAR